MWNQSLLDPIDQRDLTFPAKSLVPLYRHKPLRKLVLLIIRQLERDRFTSGSLRSILLRYYQVYVGAYSYGPCLIPAWFPGEVYIGRYASIADQVQIFRRNHPLDRLSTHPYFFNSKLGEVPEDNIPQAPLSIMHDTWVGHGVKITSGCNRIGIGAVVGAGAVVTRDVPDFAIFGGVPAKLIKYRFDEQTRESILQSEWWDLPLATLLGKKDLFTAELTERQLDSLQNLSQKQDL